MKANKVTEIKARATAVERAALDAIARQEGRKPSEQLREMVRQEAQARGLWTALVEQQAQGGWHVYNDLTAKSPRG